MQPDPERLRAIPLFADLGESERSRLAGWMEVREASQGERLTAEGKGGYEFFVIERGGAEVVRDGRPIKQLAEGDFFGEMAMLGDGRRVADVIATSPATLLVMFGTDFREMEAEMPEAAATIRATMNQRLSAS
jgi:voltage-gated potassium channel